MRTQKCTPQYLSDLHSVSGDMNFPLETEKAGNGERKYNSDLLCRLETTQQIVSRDSLCIGAGTHDMLRTSRASPEGGQLQPQGPLCLARHHQHATQAAEAHQNVRRCLDVEVPATEEVHARAAAPPPQGSHRKQSLHRPAGRGAQACCR